MVSLISTTQGLASSESTSPPTQYMESDYATTGCSKALWGLRLRVEVGLCASKVNFAGHIAGTVEPSLDHYASRQLSDKVLRYLKRVIVTPLFTGPSPG